MEFMQDLYNWMMGLMGSPYTPLWLFLLAAAGSSFFPMPPDALLIGMGVAAPHSAFLYAAICTAGSVIGGGVGYAIGYYGGRPVAIKLFKEEKLLAAEKVYQKYDIWAIGAAGFTPIPYKIFTILSGAMEVRFWRFMLVSLLSRGARFFLVATVLFFFGKRVEGFLDKYFAWVTLALFAGIVGGFIAVGVVSKWRTKVTSGPESGNNSS